MTLEPLLDSVNHFCRGKGMQIELTHDEFEDCE